MGLFDTVMFSCPRCQSMIEEQTKAGHCTLSTFHQNEVPMEIATDIKNGTVYCDKCATSYTIVALDPITTVRMRLVAE